MAAMGQGRQADAEQTATLSTRAIRLKLPLLSVDVTSLQLKFLRYGISNWLYSHGWFCEQMWLDADLRPLEGAQKPYRCQGTMSFCGLKLVPVTLRAAEQLSCFVSPSTAAEVRNGSKLCACVVETYLPRINLIRLELGLAVCIDFPYS